MKYSKKKGFFASNYANEVSILDREKQAFLWIQFYNKKLLFFVNEKLKLRSSTDSWSGISPNLRDDEITIMTA